MYHKLASFNGWSINFVYFLGKKGMQWNPGSYLIYFILKLCQYTEYTEFAEYKMSNTDMLFSLSLALLTI